MKRGWRRMNKLSSSLGLCRRAGKLVMGTDMVREAIRKGKIALALVASDATENAFTRLSAIACHRGVPCRRIPLTKAELSQALGLTRACAAVGVPKEFLDLVSAGMCAE